MNKKGNKANCCSPSDISSNCCKVEALVSLDERGQMVLPKEAREKLDIHAGDKLAIISCAREGKICCLTMIKVEELTDMVKELLGPLMAEMFQK